jgi:kanamycin kinase
MVAGQPTTDLPVPASVRAVAAGRRVRPVWRNELGGLTFEVGTGPARCFVKWAPTASGIDLSSEAARLAWAAAFTRVPRVLAQGTDARGSWLVTGGLPGESAVSERWTAAPARAVRAIGRGQRALHEALPVERCPFSWSIADRLADVHRRAASGSLDPARWHPSHRVLTVPQALAMLADPPPVDRLVVCHGDACAPNTLLTDDGRWSGHVDLGALGVADRWADLAIATWSTVWNYGPGWEEQLLAAYGIEADPGRIAYYRLLWDLGP